jgi:hypothetical protein
MENKSVEEKLSAEIDAYLNGVKVFNIPESEYSQILEVSKSLADNDFSKKSDKKSVLNDITDKLEANKNLSKIKGDNIMNKSYKIKRTAAIAASIALVSTICVSVAKPSFAEDIINKITLGHITIVQENVPKDVSDKDSKPAEQKNDQKANATKNTKAETKFIPLYDKAGNLVDTAVVRKGGTFYTADGTMLMMSSGAGEQAENNITKNQLVVNDINDINKYTAFKITLPSYLPGGYTFDKAAFYKDSNGKVSDKFADLYFKNVQTGKDIFIQERLAGDDTKYENAVDSDTSVEKVKINGADAAITGSEGIEWEANGTMYSLNCKLGRNELVKIAESIK